MTRLLAIETATDACSVAISDGDAIHLEHSVEPRRHADLVLQYVQRALRSTDLTLNALDAIVLSRGPGSFTGVRIATAVVQGLALGAGLPVVPVSTLAVAAQGAMRRLQTDYVAVAFDARMDEVYFGTFSRTAGGLANAISAEVVCAPEDVQLASELRWLATGSGWAPYATRFLGTMNRQLQMDTANEFPSAVDALTLGQFAFASGQHVPAGEALPVYLRNRVTR